MGSTKSGQSFMNFDLPHVEGVSFYFLQHDNMMRNHWIALFTLGMHASCAMAFGVFGQNSFTDDGTTEE